MSISAPPQVGQFGAQAAARYQQAWQANPAQVRTQAVRYAADISQSGWANDLFAYVQAFHTPETRGQDSFTSTQIEEATGLNLNTALDGHSEDIIDLWDQNHDHKVDTQELATGILSIDGASGPPDGTMTKEKRTATEANLLSYAHSKHQHENRAQTPSAAASQGPASLMSALAHHTMPALDLPGLHFDAVGFTDEEKQALLSIPFPAHTEESPFHLPGSSAQSFDSVAETAFRQPLRNIAETVKLQEKYNAFTSGQ